MNGTLEGLNFKWISPITGGETYGVIKKVYKYRFDHETMIESTNNNIYNLNECFVQIGDKFEKIDID